MPKGQTVGFMDKKVSENIRACANQETGDIKFNSKFLQDPEKYGRDMMTVFHELRHIAQYHGKKNEDHNTDKLNLSYANQQNLITMLVCTELCRPHEDIGVAWQYDSTVTSLFYSKWNQYLFAKYFYSPCERDARMFGRKYLSSIMESVKQEELNDKEKKNYDLIMKNIEEDTKKENEQLSKFATTIKEDENSFISVSKKAQERYIPMCEKATSVSVERLNDYVNRYGFDCFDALFSSLCFTYNEENAQKFYNTCLNMPTETNKYLSFALNLIKYSNFKPTKEQFDSLCKKCKDFNSVCEDKTQHLDPVKTLEKMKTNQTQESMTNSLGML